VKGERNEIGARVEWEWIRRSVEMWIGGSKDYYGRGKDWRRCNQAMRKRVRCAKVWE